VGIFTDGDLRRAIDKALDLKRVAIDQVMTPGPRTIGPDRLAVEAVRLMQDFRITQVLVVDERNRLVGALNAHDLMRAGVI
jgi:arabinose-5-phosphate isomerase